jgi:hypothetical protein
MCSLSWSVHCNVVGEGKRVKGSGRASPPPPPLSRADFSIMMECTLEIGNCHSVCTLWYFRPSLLRVGVQAYHTTSLYLPPPLELVTLPPPPPSQQDQRDIATT